MRSLIFILAVFIVFSGCVEEKNVIKTNESVYQEPKNTTPEDLSSKNLSSDVENHPEIELRSFSCIYNLSNSKKMYSLGFYNLSNYEKMYVLGYNITERRYLVYNLSITNNGSKYLDFELDGLNVRDGDTIYNAENNTIHEPEYSNSYREDMLLDLEKITKIEDKRLYPGQTISGSAIFHVNSSHNSSDDNAFQLSYKEIPVSSDSFKKSNEALNLAERYNYSIVFGLPPYDLYGFVNYVNKSTIEFIKKTDSDMLLNDSTENRELPEINVVYAIKVIPEKSIRSIFERNIISGPESYPENRFIVIDNTGEELINASKTDIITILKNQTYELHSGGSRYIRGSRDIPQMNFSNATLVIISYQYINSPGFMSFIDQDLILDDKMNIVEARYNCRNYQGA